MKSELEPQDIETIAQRVVHLLKPLLSGGQKQEEDGTVFTVETLSEYLQVDRSWVYKQVSLKTVPYFKSGKYTRFRRRDIDRWISSQTVNPVPFVSPSLKIVKNRG